MIRPLFSDPPQRSHVCCEKNFSLMFRPLLSEAAFRPPRVDYWRALKSSSVLIFSSSSLLLISVSFLAVISCRCGVLTALFTVYIMPWKSVYIQWVVKKSRDNKHGFIPLVLRHLHLLFKQWMLLEKKSGFSRSMIKNLCKSDRGIFWEIMQKKMGALLASLDS